MDPNGCFGKDFPKPRPLTTNNTPRAELTALRPRTRAEPTPHRPPPPPRRAPPPSKPRPLRTAHAPEERRACAVPRAGLMRLCAPPARRACALLPAGTRARERVSAVRVARGGLRGAPAGRRGGTAGRGGGCAAPPEARCQTGRQMKYILVTGGVISGIGKGIIASSIGTILKSSGLRVTSIKIDPYINIDAGTFSPYEHGERRAGGSQHGSALCPA